MGTTLIAVFLLLLLAWFFWPSRNSPRPHADNPALDAAERDVQEAADEHTVRDWGPGTGQKPLP